MLRYRDQLEYDRLVKEYAQREAAEQAAAAEAAERERQKPIQRAFWRHFDQTLKAALDAIRAETLKPVTTEHELYARHIAALVAEAPAIQVTFLQSGSTAASLVGRQSAVAMISRSEIYVWPLKSEQKYVEALHEIGHVRTPHSSRKILDELRAWRWAMAKTRVWTPAAHARFCECLKTYLASAELRDLPEATDADALMSDDGYARVAKPLTAALRGFKVERFEALYGRRDCATQYCDSRPAEMVGGTTPMCNDCLSLRDLRLERAAKARMNR